MKENFLKEKLYKLIENKFGIAENLHRNIGIPKRVLIVRQHNQFGDLLANVSLFRALKESFPQIEINVIVSKQNFYGITSNEFVDDYFIFDKKKLTIISYLKSIKKFLRKDYDVAIVPSTVAISFTSNFLARLSDAKIKIGPLSLNGKKNKAAFLFDRRINLDWHKFPDSHVSDFGLDIIRPFGITTRNFSSSVPFSSEQKLMAEIFLNKFKTEDSLIVGIHPGAGKPKNRWSLDRFIQLIERLNDNYKITFYFTGTTSDKAEIDYLRKRINFKVGYFINRTIPELAALIASSDLFITNDTGVMHVAGTTQTPQISIFGPTNPFNWAPVGPRKYFMRKSELINDVSVDDVFELSSTILNKCKELNYE